ncbi:chaplin [Streptomyces aureus]
MRQNLSRGVVLAAAATGIMSLYASPAFADSNATSTASDSPGVASGNNVQVPVNVPLNVCGNTVDVVAALNPAFGNSCANGPVSQGRHAAPHHPAQQGPGSAHHPVQHGPGSAHHPGQHGPGSAHHPGQGPDHGRGHGGHGAEHGGQGGYGGEHGGRGGYGDEHGGGHRGGGQGGYGDEHGGYGGEHRGHGPSGYGDEHGGYGDDSRHTHHGHAGARHDDARGQHGGWSGSSAVGRTQGSPGVLSGDQAGVPVDVPVEACGNTLDVVGLLNPVFGNQCGHHHAPQAHPAPHHHCTPPATPPRTPPRTVPQPPKSHTPHTPVVHTPPKVHEQPPAPPTVHTPPSLAETGSEGMIANAAISAVLLAGGTLLYRRSRAASRP